MNEIFKDIKDYEGLYQVSNLGNVRSLKRISIKNDGVAQQLKERILQPINDRYGYMFINLYKGGKPKVKYIHRLVGITLINNPKDKPQINHKDGNRRNNNITNLEWVSSRENNSHSFKNKKTSSKYTGVSYHKSNKKWDAYIKINQKLIRLRSFDNEEDAHQAYLNALKKYGLTNKYA